ncbi:MAG: Nif3-like dinuclear metal center hexameric protein [Chthoniobacter sp.]|nr:Nif3-like dinuclear metal center hexameric protein [Chthoniobacter sp.]
MPKLVTIVTHLDRHLRHAEVADFSGAWNGLQVENSGEVTKVGAAVDACSATIEQAVDKGIQLLLVHHGLFWAGVQPVTGPARRRIKTALDGNLAIYSSHLPLDLHPQLGNNALLCRALGFTKCTPFFHEKGQFIGFQTKAALTRDELTRRLEKILDRKPHLSPGGPAKTARIGIVTGGAGAEVAVAAAEGVDTFITGEGPQHSYILAEELGVNLFYGGHYATETFGVKALAAHVARRFKVPWEFIDHPTGL